MIDLLALLIPYPSMAVFVIAILVVVSGITWVLSSSYPRTMYCFGWSLIGFGGLNWLVLYVGSKTSLPLSPYLLCFVGIMSFFLGMAIFIGFGIWKITSQR